MKKGLKIALGIVGGVAAVWALIALLPRPNNYKLENTMLKEDGLPILIAHGGGNKEFPDNTLEAFYNAYSVDKNVMMETDVSITKDGVVILSHDTTLDRKTNVTGAIADWNYTDLIEQRVDFGYTNPTSGGVLNGEREHFKTDDGVEKYPTDVTYPEGVEPRDTEIFFATTLEELITAFPESRINVEVKQSGETGLRALEEIIRLLREYDAFDRVVLASFHEELYDRFCEMKNNGEVPEEFMFSPAYAGGIKFLVLHWLGLDVFFTDKMCVFQLPTEKFGIDLTKASFIKKANRHNMAVHYWTVNDADEMRHLIDVKADGIMSDYPHRLKEVLDEYK